MERESVHPDNTRYDVTDIRVRYADTDQMGVAYNGAYFTWFEIGRTELLRHTPMTYNDIEKNGVMLPVIEAGIKFVKPALYDDVVSIYTRVERQKGVRIRFAYELKRGATLLATGFTEHAFTDMSMKPVRPTGILADLASFIESVSTDESAKRTIL